MRLMTAVGNMKTISTADIQHKLAQQERSFHLIDVRELDEYEAGRLPGALFMPWHIIEEKIKGIKPDTELILYCRTGVRGKKAAEILENLGFTNITLYKDGWEGWEKVL